MFAECSTTQLEWQAILCSNPRPNEQHTAMFTKTMASLYSVLQELTARTGLNPAYTYLQIGCSKNQENTMLRFARSCVGKPFSGSAMARSLLWPRQTDNTSFFCAGDWHVPVPGRFASRTHVL